MKDKHKIRDNFRNEVFKRDGYKCRVCGRSDVKLDAHHIMNRRFMPSGGYIKENGVTLCDTENGCHFKAEDETRKSQTVGYVPSEFSPFNLYKLINSSYEIAYKKSKEL